MRCRPACRYCQLRRDFSPESKAKTVEMVKDIEDAMDNNIDTLTWMSPETN
jgi:predicted metalloendopeptidase